MSRAEENRWGFHSSVRQSITPCTPDRDLKVTFRWSFKVCSPLLGVSSLVGVSWGGKKPRGQNMDNRDRSKGNSDALRENCSCEH